MVPFSDDLKRTPKTLAVSSTSELVCGLSDSNSDRVALLAEAFTARFDFVEAASAGPTLSAIPTLTAPATTAATKVVVLRTGDPICIDQCSFALWRRNSVGRPTPASDCELVPRS